MLSIGKLTPGRADYYVEQVHAGQDEYYMSDQAERGYWTGRAAARLGLEGDVGAEAFRRVLDGCHPGSGEPLGAPSTTANRVAGFDLCFSAPKSVSLAWALGPPEMAKAIAGAHDRAVAQSLEAIEEEVLRARRGAGGQVSIETGGLVAAAFPHRSSRGGDPQLHTHVVAANITPDDSGRWSAPDGARFYRWAKTVGFLYQAALRAEMGELGFSWGPVRHGHADLAGVSRDVIDAFSSRRADIQAALEEKGLSSGAAAQAATLSTRAPKGSVPELPELRRQWAERASQLGIGPGFVTNLARSRPEVLPDIYALEDELLGTSGLTANASSFDRRSVLQALAHEHGSGAGTAYLRQAADELLARPEVVALAPVPRAEQRYSTAELVAIESAVLDRATRAQSAGLALVPEDVLTSVLETRPSLSDEQRAMVSTLASSGAGVQVTVGRAGTGKTYALDAARAAWEASGHRVIGASLAARAAAELQAGAGIPSSTVDRLLADLERPGPLSGLAPGTVVVVDEAGLLGTRKLARLLDHAEHWQAAVVLVGDPRQLPEVEAGGAFGALAKSLPVVELTNNRRQHEAWERDALADLRAGSVARAIVAYEKAGRVTLAPSADEAREAMVSAWWSSRQQGDDAMMYAVRRSDVEDLNTRARARLEGAGLLGQDRLAAGGREFAVGDRVMYLRNDRRLGVRNGDIATVATVGADEIGLSDGARLPVSYVEAGNLTFSYASTVHKAQGATVDRAFLLGSDQLYREAGYVGLSRARLSNELFVVAADVGQAHDGLVEGLQTSRAQSLALHQLEPGTNLDAIARRQARALLADPPPWATEALGPPPLSGSDRAHWAGKAAQLASYRDTYGVTDPSDALGPEPTDSTHRQARQIAELALLDQQRTLDLERGLSL